MDSFTGPFKFDIDDEGTPVEWGSLDKEIKEELLHDGRISEEDSTVYMFSITADPCDTSLEKHHDWQKVTRVFIEAKVGHKSMKIGGISPRNKKSEHAAPKKSPDAAKGDAKINLFNMAKVTLTISNMVKNNATVQGMAILSGHTGKSAKWVYSKGWPYIEFRKHVYVAVPKRIPKKDRLLKVSIKPVRQKNIPLTMASVFEHPVTLPG